MVKGGKLCGQGEAMVDLLSFSRFLSFILTRKLKALKVNIRIWNEQVFGIVETHKRILLDELHVLDGLEEKRAIHDENKLRKVKVISDLERATLLEEMYWMKKLRA
jgi:hypothetical protein